MESAAGLLQFQSGGSALLNARLKNVATRFLPGFLLRRLDPIQDIIESEVREAASLLSDKHTVLDAGAGEARHRQYFTRGRYIALDAGRGDAAWDYSRLDVLGNLESLPFRSHSVDRVLCMVVLEHTRNPRAVLGEFARVLKRGGTLYLVVPLLWEEHQTPHDYFRFTRYGMQYLFEGLPFDVDRLEPMGGLFWVCARRCVNLLSVFQGGWRWLAFVLLAPFLGFLFPIALYFLDPLDRDKRFSLGFRIRASRKGD